MIPVWNFLVTHAKFEKTVRNIRRNITVHGGDAKEEAGGKGGAERRTGARRRGFRGDDERSGAREMDFAAKEVERPRNAVRRQRKDLRVRMLEVSRERGGERKRILDERANYGLCNE
ncbi:hypothetical protein Fmac_030428 [Flemingia macrophylla]|uniref:Uncharacterized protein n=1 Tax=Flemingia macrophylla TaxID=520843 RepID=A0ABD1KZ80_9FABA